MFSPQALKAIGYYLRGYTQLAACEAAGLSPSYAKEFFLKDNVKEEVERRKRKMVQRQEVDEAWIMERMVRIADSSPGDLVEIDLDGMPYFDWSKLTPEMKKVLGAISIEEFKEGRGKGSRGKVKVNVKGMDQLRALELIGKHLGMFKQEIVINNDDDMVNRLLKGRQRVAREPLADGTEL